MIKNQIWNPWIGDSYHKQENKLLLIGESHYAQDKEGKPDEECFESFKNDPNITSGIIQELIKGTSWSFFDNTYRLLLGRTDIDIDVEKFWSKVSFYTLIQRPMKTRKERPTKEDFNKYIKLSLDINKEYG